MNKSRRQELKLTISELEEIQTRIEMVKDEESDAFENLPDGLKYSEKGEKMSENVETLNDVYDSIFDMIDSINETIE